MFSMGRPWGHGFKVDDKREETIEGYWDQAKFIKGKPTEEILEDFEN